MKNDGFTALQNVAELNLGAIVEVLNQHDVRFVIIGGIAAQLRVPATVDIT